MSCFSPLFFRNKTKGINKPFGAVLQTFPSSSASRKRVVYTFLQLRLSGMKTRGCPPGLQGAREKLLPSSGWTRHEEGRGCWDPQPCDPLKSTEGDLQTQGDPVGLLRSLPHRRGRHALAHRLVPAPTGHL